MRISGEGAFEVAGLDTSHVVSDVTVVRQTYKGGHGVLEAINDGSTIPALTRGKTTSRCLCQSEMGLT